MALSPAMAAAASSGNRTAGLNVPWAANAPATNSSESPGRKGRSTTPVSMKITANSTT
jgi:hypothetical protein